MFKGYKNHLLSKDRTNKKVSYLAHINKCPKCGKLNPSLRPPITTESYTELNNVENCLYCGNPFYVFKLDK